MKILIIGGHDESFSSLFNLNFEFIILQIPNKIGYNQKLLTNKIVQLDYTNIEKLINTVKRIHEKDHIDFVFSFTEDGLYPTATVSDYFSIKSNNTNSCKICLNKIKMRNTLKNTKFHVPYQSCDRIEEALQFYNNNGPYVIMKDQSGSGSKDVFIIKNIRELNDKFDYFSKNNILPVLLEKNLEGEEYSIETLSIRGKHEFIGVTKKYLYKETTIEEKHIFPAPDLSLENFNKIEIFAKEILELIEYTHGSCHFEIKIFNGNISLIEINNRPGGDLIWKMVKLVKGIDLIRETIEFISSGYPTAKTRTHGLEYNIMSSVFLFRKHDKGLLEKKLEKYFKKIVQLEIFHPESKEILSSDDRYGSFLIGDKDKFAFLNSFYNMEKILCEY